MFIFSYCELSLLLSLLLSPLLDLTPLSKLSAERYKEQIIIGVIHSHKHSQLKEINIGQYSIAANSIYSLLLLWTKHGFSLFTCTSRPDFCMDGVTLESSLSCSPRLECSHRSPFTGCHHCIIILCLVTFARPIVFNPSRVRLHVTGRPCIVRVVASRLHKQLHSFMTNLEGCDSLQVISQM